MKNIRLLVVFLFIIVTLAQNDEAPEIDLDIEDALGKTDQQFMSMRRTACLVLSRYHSNTQKDTIQNIVQSLSPENQQKYINKVYAVAVETCESTITQDEVQELFVQNQQFDPTPLFRNFDGVDYAAIVNDIENFTPNQDSIIKFMKKFDEQMAIRKQQQQAQKQRLQGDDKYEMKLFGISFSSISPEIKMVYLLIFFAVFGGAIYYGFSQLDSDKKKNKSNKRRKSPKKE